MSPLFPECTHGSWSQKQYSNQLDFVDGSGGGQRKKSFCMSMLRIYSIAVLISYGFLVFIFFLSWPETALFGISDNLTGIRRA